MKNPRLITLCVLASAECRTRSNLTHLTGLADDQIRNALSNLKRDGEATNPDRGVWCATDKGRSHAACLRREGAKETAARPEPGASHVGQPGASLGNPQEGITAAIDTLAQTVAHQIMINLEQTLAQRLTAQLGTLTQNLLHQSDERVQHLQEGVKTGAGAFEKPAALPEPVTKVALKPEPIVAPLCAEQRVPQIAETAPARMPGESKPKVLPSAIVVGLQPKQERHVYDMAKGALSVTFLDAGQVSVERLAKGGMVFAMTHGLTAVALKAVHEAKRRAGVKVVEIHGSVSSLEDQLTNYACIGA